MLKLKINKYQIIGLSLALIIIILSFIFLYKTKPNLFYFLGGIAFVIAGFPFFLSLIFESRIKKEKNEMFLEFARNLVESVKAGTPISKSILNIRTKDYGGLNPHINKLANQISIGIPLKTALDTFARDVESPTINQAITIISESEKAGGEIEDILEAVATSVGQIEKLRKERMAAMYTLVVQGYIIFLIFVIIMIVMQFQVLPIASSLNSGTMETKGSESIGNVGLSSVMGGGKPATPDELSKPFFWLLITQGFFVGLVIGKLSENEIKYGLKHSFILVVLALLISTGAKLFLG